MGNRRKNKTKTHLTNGGSSPSDEATRVDDRSCFLCSRTDCDSKCEHCGLVYFCGDDHKRLHRPEQLCFPFRIEVKEGVGRCMVATRDIQPLGE